MSGVVIWTLQASCLKPQTFRTHFRSVDSKKKKKRKTISKKGNKASPESLGVDRLLCSNSCATRSNWAGRRTGGDPHCCLCRAKRSCSGLHKISSSCLNCYFCFLPLTWREHVAVSLHITWALACCWRLHTVVDHHGGPPLTWVDTNFTLV